MKWNGKAQSQFHRSRIATKWKCEERKNVLSCVIHTKYTLNGE